HTTGHPRCIALPRAVPPAPPATPGPSPDAHRAPDAPTPDARTPPPRFRLPDHVDRARLLSGYLEGKTLPDLADELDIALEDLITWSEQPRAQRQLDRLCKCDQRRFKHVQARAAISAAAALAEMVRLPLHTIRHLSIPAELRSQEITLKAALAILNPIEREKDFKRKLSLRRAIDALKSIAKPMSPPRHRRPPDHAAPSGAAFHPAGAAPGGAGFHPADSAPSSDHPRRPNLRARLGALTVPRVPPVPPIPAPRAPSAPLTCSEGGAPSSTTPDRLDPAERLAPLRIGARTDPRANSHTPHPAPASEPMKWATAPHARADAHTSITSIKSTPEAPPAPRQVETLPHSPPRHQASRPRDLLNRAGALPRAP
ncbi:MAG: hypothetical protein ACF8R7_08560, partial [Phycisphaerales bacterium JB039]